MSIPTRALAALAGAVSLAGVATARARSPAGIARPARSPARRMSDGPPRVAPVPAAGPATGRQYAEADIPGPAARIGIDPPPQRPLREPPAAMTGAVSTSRNEG
jgi:hypothetical protein